MTRLEHNLYRFVRHNAGNLPQAERDKLLILLRKYTNEVLGVLNEEAGEMHPFFLSEDEYEGSWQDGWAAAKVRISELLFDERLH